MQGDGEKWEIDKESGVEKLAYADSCAAVNSYLSRTAAWELCSSPVRKEESKWASNRTEMKRKMRETHTVCEREVKEGRCWRAQECRRGRKKKKEHTIGRSLSVLSLTLSCFKRRWVSEQSDKCQISTDEQTHKIFFKYHKLKQICTQVIWAIVGNHMIKTHVSPSYKIY